MNRPVPQHHTLHANGCSNRFRLRQRKPCGDHTVPPVRIDGQNFCASSRQHCSHYVDRSFAVEMHVDYDAILGIQLDGTTGCSFGLHCRPITLVGINQLTQTQPEITRIGRSKRAGRDDRKAEGKGYFQKTRVSRGLTNDGKSKSVWSGKGSASLLSARSGAEPIFYTSVLRVTGAVAPTLLPLHWG